MRKFKIEKQQTLYAYNETNIPQIKTIEFVGDDFKLVKGSVPITEKNIEIAKTINPDYEIGQIHYGPLEVVEFYSKDLDSDELILIDKIRVFADPYYKLFEEVDNEWVLIDKHSCC